jgi:hypothetical protein
MNRHFWLFFSVFLAIFLLNGCKNSTNQVPQTQEDSLAMEEKLWKNAPLAEPLAPLDVRLVELDDKVKNTWLILSELDNNKFATVDKLVTTFKALKGVNKSVLDSVQQLSKQAVSLRYTEQNLNNSLVLDKYDQTVELLMKKIDRLHTSTPTGELEKCTDCGQLIAEIRQADSEDLTARIRYASAAQDLNSLIEKEKKAIKKLAPKFQQIQKVNIFAN